MVKSVVAAGRRSPRDLAWEINNRAREAIARGDFELILVIGEEVEPERILKIISATLGRKGKVDLVVRHAELQEYLEHTLVGAVAGAGIATAVLLYQAMVAGGPIAWGALLSYVALGAAIGAIIGMGTTPITHLRVYKYRGETRIKFIAAAVGHLASAF